MFYCFIFQVSIQYSFSGLTTFTYTFPFALEDTPPSQITRATLLHLFLPAKTLFFKTFYRLSVTVSWKHEKSNVKSRIIDKVILRIKFTANAVPKTGSNSILQCIGLIFISTLRKHKIAHINSLLPRFRSKLINNFAMFQSLT